MIFIVCRLTLQDILCTVRTFLHGKILPLLLQENKSHLFSHWNQFGPFAFSPISIAEEELGTKTRGGHLTKLWFPVWFIQVHVFFSIHRTNIFIFSSKSQEKHRNVAALLKLVLPFMCSGPGSRLACHSPRLFCSPACLASPAPCYFVSLLLFVFFDSNIFPA